MKLKSWKTLAICLVAGFGLVLWVFTTGKEGEQNKTTAQDLSSEPNLNIQTAEIVEYDDDGARLFEVSAESIEYSLTDETIAITEIDLNVYSVNGVNWRLTAGAGLIRQVSDQTQTSQGQRIDLLGDVRVMSQDHDTTTLSLIGQDLVFDPYDKRLSSQHPVTITNDKATLRAPKFEFDLESNEFHLSGTSAQQVQVIYKTPNSR